MEKTHTVQSSPVLAEVVGGVSSALITVMTSTKSLCMSEDSLMLLLCVKATFDDGDEPQRKLEAIS